MIRVGLGRWILVCGVAFSLACVAPTLETRPERDRPDGLIAEGKISFYGEWFRGKPTANGEPFNPDGLTAAHKSMKFGSCLVVENLENGRKVKVRVNDRGPYVKGRILDVSLGAAKRLDMIEKGVVRARLWRC